MATPRKPRKRHEAALRTIALHFGQRRADFQRRQSERLGLHIAQCLTAWREAAGLTRTQVARCAHCTLYTVTRIEQGEGHHLELFVLDRIAWIFGRRFEDLLRDFTHEPYDATGEDVSRPAGVTNYLRKAPRFSHGDIRRFAAKQHHPPTSLAEQGCAWLHFQ